LLPWPFHTAVSSRGAFFTHEKAETKSWEAVAINHHSSNHNYAPVLGPEQLEISRKERHTFENDVDMNKRNNILLEDSQNPRHFLVYFTLDSMMPNPQKGDFP
jgi:hypothetical protein